MTVPDTAAPPCAITVNVAELIVAAFIAWLKVAVRAVFTATPVAQLESVTEATEGAVDGVDVREPELDPPHPETTIVADTRRKDVANRMIRFPHRLLLAERIAEAIELQSRIAAGLFLRAPFFRERAINYTKQPMQFLTRDWSRYVGIATGISLGRPVCVNRRCHRRLPGPILRARLPEGKDPPQRRRQGV